MAAVDSFKAYPEGLAAPAYHMVAITPADGADLDVVTRAILASADCTAKVTMLGGETVDDVPLQKGYNPLQVSKVFQTGTTLGGASLFGLW